MYADPSGHIALSTLLISMAIGAVIGFATSYVPDVVKNFGDGFEWADFNTFEDNWLKYVGATLGGAISGMGVGLGTTILTSGIGNVVEAAFAGNIDTFGDFLLRFTIGGVLGGVGFGISKGIASSLADKKILGILGSLNNNTKVNKRLAKAGFGHLNIARDGFSKVYNTMYKELGYESLENGISIGYDVLTGFIF